jgi:hypothetical protein
VAAAREVRSLSRLRERAGERVSPQRDSPRGKSPHPALCADLSRKRARLSEPAAPPAQTNAHGFDGVSTSGGFGLGFAGGGPGAGLTSIGGGNGAAWLVSG